MQREENLSIIQPIIVGEILYDVFADGQRVLGGAPLNVAWHLQGLGLAPLLITRLGKDDWGDEVLRILQQWGLDTRFIQWDAQHPTGRVQVTVDKGTPHFDIAPQQAYDYLEATLALSVLPKESYPLLYHGTLALRAPASRHTVETLIQSLTLPVFLDMNLRAPWWDWIIVESCLHTATWVKMSVDEFRAIEPTLSETDWEATLDAFCQRYDLAAVIITLGTRGALLKARDSKLLQVTAPTVAVVDTVGAGDAFSAVVILGLLKQWPLTVILERAVAFAAAICQVPGATTPHLDFYTQFLKSW